MQFLFPFQRRARSHSPPSEEQIHNKIAEAISSNIKGDKERSWSKNHDHNKNSSPVVANTSFMIGGIDFNKGKKLGRKGITREEKEMLKGKEVEEWLKNNRALHGVSKGEMDFEGFLDDQEVVTKVKSSLQQDTACWNETKDKGNDGSQWMYQTVDSFNDNASKERKHYDTDDQENESPNIYKQMKLTDRHLEEFLNQGKILEEFTFSVDASPEC